MHWAMVARPSVVWSRGFQKMLFLGPQCPQGWESNPALLTQAGVSQ